MAADKGYSYAAQENAGLPEKTQRALGVYAAPGGVVIARGDKEGAAGQHESDGEPKSVAGTSVFDPVLCECMYRWYVPQGGKILDPFAGGSTRGIVANYLGYDYTGVEIRQGQIDANVRQAQTAIERSSGRMAMPTWIHGDSTNLTEVLDNHDPFSEYDSCSRARHTTTSRFTAAMQATAARIKRTRNFWCGTSRYSRRLWPGSSGTDLLPWLLGISGDMWGCIRIKGSNMTRF